MATPPRHSPPHPSAPLRVLNNEEHWREHHRRPLDTLAALPEDLSPLDRAQTARELTALVEGEVRFGLHDRMLYATDASLYQIEPLGVFIPASTQDAVRGVRFCRDRRLPILPRGGGTSLAGQCTNRAVVFDFSPNCRSILRLDAAAREVEVEPGITLDDLNDAISASGLFFAPDPATSKQANVGGCIGNNAAGARSILFGRTSENVRGVDVCLADGFVARLEQGAASRHARIGRLTREVADVVLKHAALIKERFPKTVRRNAGYNLDLILKQLEESQGDLDAVNLAHLICGSEGTLALTLGARLKLHPKPAFKGLAVLGFASLDESMDVVQTILETKPSAVELLDDTVVDLARANTEYRRYVDLMPQPKSGELKAVLYVEYFASSEADLRERFAALASRLPHVARQEHTNAGSMLNAWKLRKAGEPLLHGIPGHRKPLTFVEDNAIPVEHLPTFVKKFRSVVQHHGTRAAFYAHASVGVLHVRPLLDLHDESDRARLRSIAVEIADLARSLGGVMSGEHGDGRVRSPLLERFYGPELIEAFRQIKRIFDPHNLLNPGNIVTLDGPQRSIDSMTQTLRLRPAEVERRVPEVETYFTYDDQHGFDAAVEMCNGAGVCRKKSSGTMCPSYMATLDERHSTRGRGNALRLAITGQFNRDDHAPPHETAAPPHHQPPHHRPHPHHPDQPRWDDPGTIETLGLCLSCKACKTECPSNVDISRLKAEYTAQRYREHGTPLQARFFGHVRELSALASRTPALANFVNALPLTRALLRKLVGIDPRRTLPRFARSLARDFADERRRQGADPNPTKPVVAIFGDCFTMFNDPHIGRASRDLFERLGYDVRLADAGCCGRSLISTGLLPAAITQIEQTLDRLKPWILDQNVQAILVHEPSCLSAMLDDWRQLKLSTPRALLDALATKAMLPEQFFASRTHPNQPLIDHARAKAASARGSVILHGHCHQKALWGADSSANALRLIAGDRVRVLDSGCCGMAGSFGYTTDRYDLSMKIGERVLLPEARAASSADTIVAPGTSCRHQIHDGAQRHALHPIEFILAAMPSATMPP